MAVNEKTGVIVQDSEGGYTGMLNVARKSTKLYFMRTERRHPGQMYRGPVKVIEVDLAKLFADSEARRLNSASDPDEWEQDRHTHEIMLLSAGHKVTAADHPHPTFSPDGTRIEIQSAMLSEDNRSMNIIIKSVPEIWLKRKY